MHSCYARCLAEGEDRLFGWSTDAAADALAELAAGESGLTVKRLTAPGTAALGDVRVLDRFRSGSGGLRVGLSCPTRLRGTAVGSARVVRHGVTYAGLGKECVC
ncbi:hypothetical protein ACFWBN_34760 [Streptomyces sp. NPDC059989]|uniref:hypothetical protein n=1 Tax=Streptomyces sp. NPDC059989 TaxID=3347026 RepID=UPI0036926F02